CRNRRQRHSAYPPRPLPAACLVRHAQPRSHPVFSVTEIHSCLDPPILEVLFLPSSKRSSPSFGPFLAARVLRSLGTERIPSPQIRQIHRAKPQESRSEKLAMGQQFF